MLVRERDPLTGRTLLVYFKIESVLFGLVGYIAL